MSCGGVEEKQGQGGEANGTSVPKKLTILKQSNVQLLNKTK